MRLHEIQNQMIDKDNKNLQEEEKVDPTAEAGGAVEEESKDIGFDEADDAAKKARVARQLQEIKRFRDAFTPNTIDVKELVEQGEL